MGNFALTDEQVERYSRHILLSELGVKGQKKLMASSVFVVGAGGLGSPALLYLAAAGIGRLGIVDSDLVELSNLQRQVIHGTSDLGRSKVLSAQEALRRINPDCKVRILAERLTASNVRALVEGYDVVLDGSDNFPTRFLVSDSCWLEGIPLVSAAVLRFEGQLMAIIRGPGNPCYRCFVPEPPPAGLVPNCPQAGVLGAVVGVMGTLQAVEAIKVLLGIDRGMAQRLLLYDALRCSFRTAKRVPDPDCPLCGEHPTIKAVNEYQASCATGDAVEDKQSEDTA